MQHRYVGDIGDYVKFAILRSLAPGGRIGVAWWLFPDETHNKDGRHIDYLSRPEQWRRFDPPLFDALKAIVDRGERKVQALETLLPAGTVFSSDLIPCEVRPPRRRPVERERWFFETCRRLVEAEIVFVDPDNGIATERTKPTLRRAGKSVTVAEIASLQRPNRAIIAYHHHSHFKGGDIEELRHLGDRLSAVGLSVVGALRASPWSPRAFFLLDADARLVARAEGVASVWRGLITWHPHN